MTDNSNFFDDISSKAKLRSLYVERDDLSDQLENIENYVAMRERLIQEAEAEIQRLRAEIGAAGRYKAAELLPVLNGLLDNIGRIERERARS